MGRGAQGQTQSLTDQQLAQTNALNQQLLGQQQSLGNLVTPQYQALLNNPGYSAADKAAITGQSQGALASAFDSLQQAAANRVARTGNAAGFSELTDDLARQKAQQEAGLAQQNQLNFSNTAYQRQLAALQGLSGLYGVDTNLLGRTLGIPSELLNVRANASRPSGFFSTLGRKPGQLAGRDSGIVFVVAEAGNRYSEETSREQLAASRNSGSSFLEAPAGAVQRATTSLPRRKPRVRERSAWEGGPHAGGVWRIGVHRKRESPRFVGKLRPGRTPRKTHGHIRLDVSGGGVFVGGAIGSVLALDAPPHAGRRDPAGVCARLGASAPTEHLPGAEYNRRTAGN